MDQDIGSGRVGEKRMQGLNGVGGKSDREGEVEKSGALVSGLVWVVGGAAAAEKGSTGGGAGCT